MENSSNQKIQMQILIEKFLRSKLSHTYKLNAYHRILMVMLSSYMGNKDTCYPSMKSLQDDCGMSKRTIIRSNDYLEKSNILLIKRKKEENNIYQFTDYVVSIGHHLVTNRHHLVSDSNHIVVTNRHPNNINVPADKRLKDPEKS